MDELLQLSPDDLLGSGSQREIYRHPRDREKFVKVLRDVPLIKGRSRLATVTERHIPVIKRRWVYKEYREYLRLMLRNWPEPLHPPITHMYGFAQTNLGLACLSDAVLKGDQPGPTLRAKLAQGPLSDENLALLNDAIRRLYHYDIRVGDMTARNFVFGRRRLAGRKGPRECVLVDGFGDIHAIPVRSWGRMFNQFGLDDSCKRLAQKTGLRWNQQMRQFSGPP